jgi:hypothetical protein
MKPQTVAESFATYRAAVIPRAAPEVQVDECRRAFYAGTYFCLMNLAYNIGDDATSEDDGVAELEKLKAECEAFAAAVGMALPHATPQVVEAPVVEPPNYTTPDAGEMRPILQELGGRIGAALPEGWGFNLLLFTYGAGGSLFYISSAERQDVIAVMREYIARNTH